MKRLLLLLATPVFLVSSVLAQSCSPNPLYQDSIFGIWPDTLTNLQSGQVGVWYSDTLNLIVPLDAGDIDPAFSGLIIDSVKLDAIIGLPAGVGIVCNSQTLAPCTMLPSTLGCVLVEGTPTTPGVYPISVSVTGYTVVIVPVPVPFTFTGYVMDIGAVGLAEQETVSVQGLINVPNPFNGSTDITFYLNKASNVELQVFDLLGQEIWTTSRKANQGVNKINFDGSTYEQGIYLYQLKVDGVLYTGRMVLDR